MQDLQIEKGTGEKSRIFRASLVSHVIGDALWQGGEADVDTIRPIWMMLAGTEGQLRPFVANLRLGRKAEVLDGRSRYSRSKPVRFETLRSAGYRVAWQRTPIGSAATLFLPDLFRLDPGMVDPEGISFVVLPDRRWLREPDLRATEHVRELGLVPDDRLDDAIRVLQLAPLFAGYLDRRTRCPLVPDPRFSAQILFAAIDAGMASLSTKCGYAQDLRRLGYEEVGIKAAGLAPGVAFRATHEELENLLANQVATYFESVPRKEAA